LSGAAALGAGGGVGLEADGIAFVSPRNNPASSTGTTNFVDGEAPIAFSVSRYCNNSVFWSSPVATWRMVDSPPD
jgi:hypothetical protein